MLLKISSFTDCAAFLSIFDTNADMDDQESAETRAVMSRKMQKKVMALCKV